MGTENPKGACPSITEMLNFASGRITAIEKQRVMIHATLCAKCSEVIGDMFKWFDAKAFGNVF